MLYKDDRKEVKEIILFSNYQKINIFFHLTTLYFETEYLTFSIAISITNHIISFDVLIIYVYIYINFNSYIYASSLKNQCFFRVLNNFKYTLEIFS